MANHLSMALIDTVRTLHQRGWSQRRIADELGIHRDTVARYLQAHAHPPPDHAAGDQDTCGAQPKPAIAPLGAAAATAEAKPAIAPLGSADALPTALGPSPGPGRPSDCRAWAEVIHAKLQLGLTAQRIFQDLRVEHGYTGSYYSVRRFVRRLEQVTPVPFRRLECGPGEEAQVDFGQGAPVITPEGRRRRPHVFRIVLSHSRKAYSEAVFQQSTEEFIRCLENAFWAFGGTPQRLILDNLKAAVRTADWFDPELNPKLRSFADYYGIALLPTRPRTPRHKGKIERGIDYVQENGLKGRSFSSLEDENAFLRAWEQTVADTRVHGTIRQQVGTLFVAVERPALQALPAERFPCFMEGRRTVQRDGHIEVARAYYSVPPEYTGRRVWVRWDARLVRILNDRLEQVAAHARQQPGRFSTQQRHIPSEKISGVERGVPWLLSRIRALGMQAMRWAEAVVAARGVEGVRVLQGLLALAGRHDAAAIDAACGLAHDCAEYRLATIRALLQRRAEPPASPPLLTEHVLIRPLADYDDLVRDPRSTETGHA